MKDKCIKAYNGVINVAASDPVEEGHGDFIRIEVSQSYRDSYGHSVFLNFDGVVELKGVIDKWICENSTKRIRPQKTIG